MNGVVQSLAAEAHRRRSLAANFAKQGSRGPYECSGANQNVVERSAGSAETAEPKGPQRICIPSTNFVRSSGDM